MTVGGAMKSLVVLLWGNFFQSRIDVVLGNMPGFELIDDPDFSPMFDPMLAARKTASKPFFVKEIVGNQMHDDFISFVDCHSKCAQFGNDFLMASVLIGAVMFQFLNGFRNSKKVVGHRL